MQAWEDVVKVKFTEHAKNTDASFVLHANSGVGGYAVYPNDQGSLQNIGIGTGDSRFPLNASMIHELGHGLGLQHPEGNYPENSKTHTAMSYNTPWYRPATNGVSVSTNPTMKLVKAIQLMDSTQTQNATTTV